jgi:UrcA family protein
MAFASAAALAAEPPVEQVTIRAERPAAKVVGHEKNAAPIQEYQLAYHVTYSDLDINTSVGANALKARVRKAAYSLCENLDKLYPLAEPDSTCVQKAEDGATAQVNTAIKLAQAQGKTRTK